MAAQQLSFQLKQLKSASKMWTAQATQNYGSATTDEGFAALARAHSLLNAYTSGPTQAAERSTGCQIRASRLS